MIALHGLEVSEFIVHKEGVFAACEKCKKLNQVEVHVGANYLKILFIPFIPLNFFEAFYCKNCKEIKTLKQVSESTKLEYKNIKRNIKKPLWMFSGFFVLIAVIIVSYYI